MLRYRVAFAPVQEWQLSARPERGRGTSCPTTAVSLDEARRAQIQGLSQPVRAPDNRDAVSGKTMKKSCGALPSNLYCRQHARPNSRQLQILALLILLSALTASLALAQSGVAAKSTSFEVLVRWAPLLLWGFLFNILISVAAMAIGTVAGVPVGIAQISKIAPLRWLARGVTQLFRNAPWLVLLFLCMFLIPFEIRLFGWRIPFPDWAKAIFGFALPVMANTSEIVRGAVQSVPTGQWDGATALGLSRRRTLFLVILPQCIKRMLPPWMNLYSLIAMSTVNASIVGVSEMVTLTGQAHAAEGSRPELLAPLYAFVLVCFFVYCYPIGKWTQALERRHTRLN